MCMDVISFIPFHLFQRRNTGFATVVVRVLDANDTPPRFGRPSYSAVVPENAPAGTRVLRVGATDPDEGPGGQVVYSFPEGSDAVRADKQFPRHFFPTSLLLNIAAQLWVLPHRPGDRGHLHGHGTHREGQTGMAHIHSVTKEYFNPQTYLR